MRCPACQADCPVSSRFCPACGAAFPRAGSPAPAVPAGASDAPTIDPAGAPGTVTRAFLPHDAPAPAFRAPDPPSTPPRSALTSSSFASFHGAFSPGQMLAGRYRIVSMLGKGGMGEVYRADDLTLGVPVALKFLPASIAADPVRLERFRSEVRTTRQISHPNVCRVYDMGEADGRAFISMEYIDGEDLASLLRRIGRLPADKALEISRQVCAGLAVAHDLGIIHRDLKPANIMLDGRGRARLMDFGVAGHAAELAARSDVTAGTPAYMAPEQLTGEGVSARSDIYSLGLVLYELFTGKPAWAERASSMAELRRLHRTERPTRPSSIVTDLDPIVERVIDRCLDADPSNRPASALAVAAALPGGDPLAAALAAGETPSPEMVAQSGRVGAMPVGRALLLLTVAFVALAGSILINSNTSLLSRVRPEISPTVLSTRARDMAASLGYDRRLADESCGFMVPPGYFPWLRNRSVAEIDDRNWTARLADPSVPALLFFYRASPTELRSTTIWQPFSSFDDPPQIFAGSMRLLLDPRGNLVRFESIPPRRHPPPEDPEVGEPIHPDPDWERLFTLAALDRASFKPAAPEWTPLMAADTRAAWTGDIGADPPLPVRIEAASERGKVVSFRIIYPWSAPDREIRAGTSAAETVFNAFNTTLFIAALLGGSYLSWRNIRSGRSDRRGAAVVALFILITTWVGVSFGHDRLAWLFSAGVFSQPLARALWLAMLCWLLYTALEPIVRRLWPKMLISWTRLLSGRWRDPLVGGDVLIGLAAGFCLNVAVRAAFMVPEWIGSVPSIPPSGALDALRGPRAVISWLCTGAGSAVTISMLFALLLIGARVVFRANIAAIIFFALIVSVFQFAAFEFYPPVLPLSILIAVLITALMVRVGLLALMICFFASNAIASLPVTIDLSSWYAGQTLAVLFVAGSLLLYGFFTALGGQKLVKSDPFAA